MTNHTPEHIDANDWFGSLPKEKQDFLRDNKWAMVNAAFEAGRDHLAAATAQRDELLNAAKSMMKMWDEIYPDMKNRKYPQVVLEAIEFGEALKLRNAIAKSEVKNG